MGLILPGLQQGLRPQIFMEGPLQAGAELTLWTPWEWNRSKPPPGGQGLHEVGANTQLGNV